MESGIAENNELKGEKNRDGFVLFFFVFFFRTMKPKPHL